MGERLLLIAIGAGVLWLLVLLFMYCPCPKGEKLAARANKERQGVDHIPAIIEEVTELTEEANRWHYRALAAEAKLRDMGFLLASPLRYSMGAKARLRDLKAMLKWPNRNGFTRAGDDPTWYCDDCGVELCRRHMPGCWVDEERHKDG